MVEETLLCPPLHQAVVAKKYPYYPLVASVRVGETLLYPLVNQGVRSVGAAVASSRLCPEIGLARSGQDLGKK